MPEKLRLEEINDFSEREFVARFGSLYEHSPWVAEGAYRERPFTGLSDLHDAFVRAVREAPQGRKLALIRAHPDLAGKAAMRGKLTQESTSEQSSAGLDRLSAEEYEEFTRMNREYRKKFGIPM
ncbi:MAG TPA: 2-oxo-4-hydroxy-4-carboxy-5-ureidoimidazoline decarboxylase, partial [Rubrobacteraceae bacterium]|nr:2-oxo-4-hydroxy-4-carboxy-5-ureidoimidazoline decarboxylase [Rubrobacteraceae bacterium]